jgi:guanylate kinase
MNAINSAQRTVTGHAAGCLFIVSAPSGAGKTTLCKAARGRFKDLAYSVSFTTRSARQAERHGEDYFFISNGEFEEGIRTGRWAEWAEVHGNYYGTSAQWVNDTLDEGRSILMDIDVAGARQMIGRFPQAETIFIMPPSLAELERRLRKRGTDDQKTIQVRLENARAEIAEKGWYKHLLINDDLDQATRRLVALMLACFNQARAWYSTI